MPLNVDNIKTNTLIVNGGNMCEISSPVFDIFPWLIFPKFEKTCTEVKDTSGQGLNFQGYKITGTIQNFEDTGYDNYLGTIRIKNGYLNQSIEIPFKSNGLVTYNPSASDILVSNPLSTVNKAWDSDNEYTVYFDTEFVQFITQDGDDLLIDIVNFSYASDLNVDPVSVMEFAMSFELELLVLNSFEVSYEYIEFLP